MPTSNPVTPNPVTPSEQAQQTFKAIFGQAATHIARAPGRVNLIGEHTDYNDGFVFPLAIQFHTAIAAKRRGDRQINLVARDIDNQRVQFDIDAPAAFDATATWSNYVRGVVAELLKLDYELCGADLVITGDIPMGTGLSSSASLEMAVIAALTALSNESIDAVSAARVGQAAENNFVGCQCGIMDQLISAAGLAGHAMQLDCRSLQWRHAPLPADLSVLVVDSNVQRNLVDGEYNERRSRCEEVAKALNVQALRDLTLAELQAAEHHLNPVSFRRARHVITENQRTVEMVDALADKNVPRISALMAASHASMRDDFEITVPAIDTLVEIIAEIVGERGGARMTGGGFGGCVVALVPTEMVNAVNTQIELHYPSRAGLSARTFICTASTGVFSQPGATLEI